MWKLINALGFQAGWWACVAGVGARHEIEALIFCAILISLHLHFSKIAKQETILAAIAVLIGVVTDSLLQYFSVIDFYGWALGSVSPFWLWMLWAMFALTLNSSLEFLKTQSRTTAAFLGMTMGPLTYYAGAKLGAANLDATPAHIVLLAVAWTLALPLLVMAAVHTSPKDTT